MIEIALVNEQTEVHVAPSLLALIERVVHEVLGREEIPLEQGRWEVGVTLVDDPAIQELNAAYRQKESPTDVLSFPLEESLLASLQTGGFTVGDEVPVLLGDIVISMPTAVRQAREYGHSLEREMAFLAAHGVLHLLGYDHQNAAEEKIMLAKQEDALTALGLRRERA